MKTSTKITIFIIALCALFCWFGLIQIAKRHNTPKPHQDSLKLIKRAFINGWERGATIQLEQITIHKNSVVAERAVNNIFALDTTNFGKEK